MNTNANSSTTNKWLRESVGILRTANIGTARLDCLVLLEDETGKDRSWLLAHPEFALEDRSLQRLRKKIESRKTHTPLAFIRGKTEFYGREFIITQDVLEPRPESETMIELFEELKPTGTVVDVGTGSGALGITVALEWPNIKVELLDIDVKALVVARKNATKHGLEMSIYQSDLLEKIKTADVLLANLPYIPDGYKLNDAAMNEPKLAIFGGADGLNIYRKLFGQLTNNSHSARYVLTESLPSQHQSLERIAKNAGYRFSKTSDFIQLFSYS